MIAAHYFKGRFCVDFFASVPFEILARPFTDNVDAGVANFVSMLKLVRLLRLGRMVHYFSLN